ncbi:GNAT family N-acetyltransferase [Streptomyces sp. 796.1]|uniref:GNAT family N-acetyltransferase n=1 Tax=Streptomyces sp. 796.1 TaxID=3163029 RepID=UPI0039C92E8A
MPDPHPGPSSREDHTQAPATDGTPETVLLPTGPCHAYLARAERTGIRPLQPEDEREFITRTRESVALHRPWLTPPETPEQFAYYVQRLAAPDRAGFVICELANDQIAGYVTINNIVGGAFQCGALGYGAFAHAAGRGLMAEGLGLVIDHAFGPLGLRRLEANVQPDNDRSNALARRLGFRHEGYSPEFLYVDGDWRDHERWALTTTMRYPSPGQGTMVP